MQEYKGGDCYADKEKFDQCKREGVKMCVYFFISKAHEENIDMGNYVAFKLTNEWRDMGKFSMEVEYSEDRAAFICSDAFTYDDFLNFGVELRKRLARLDKSTFCFRRLCLIPYTLGLNFFPERQMQFGEPEDENAAPYLRPSQYTNFA